MANIQIPNLPAVAALSGEELFEGVQAGTSVKISLGQVIAATRTGTPTTIPLPVSAGGTGASTAPNARTNLGLGTMSTQDASAVAITGGSINGTTIGASTPAAISGTTGDFFGNLTIENASPSLTFAETGDTADRDARIRLNDADLIFETVTDAGVQVRENMRITYNGNIGINNSLPSVALDVTGDGSFTGDLFISDKIVHSGDTNTSIRFPAVDTVTVETAGTERMRIRSDGNVLIDTDTLYVDAVNNRVGVNKIPSDELDVNGVVACTGGFIDTGTDSTATQAILSGFRSGTGSQTGGAVRIRSVGDGSGDAVEMIFDTDTTERMRINSSGVTVSGVSPAIIFAETDTTDEDARVRLNLGDLLFETITDAGAQVRENMRIGSNGRVGIGQSSPANALDVIGVVSATGGFIDTGTDSTATQVILSGFRSGDGSETGGAVRIRSVGDGTGDAVEMIFDTNSTEAMRINASGTLLIGKTAQDVTAAGVELYQSGVIYNTVSANTCQIVNRLTDDGTLVSFRQASTSEGSISVSGSTVSFNGGHLARWAQLPDNSRPDLLKGTVMSNLDQMSYWNGEENEQLNCVQVSNVNGDVNVAGVFVAWDSEDDGYNDILLGMTGDMVIRIAAGTTVQRGDLLMSAGDGTARPQGEDIVRSSTVAKVTSTHVSETYADGSYVVPCVLMAC